MCGGYGGRLWELDFLLNLSINLKLLYKIGLLIKKQHNSYITEVCRNEKKAPIIQVNTIYYFCVLPRSLFTHTYRFYRYSCNHRVSAFKTFLFGSGVSRHCWFVRRGCGLGAHSLLCACCSGPRGGLFQKVLLSDSWRSPGAGQSLLGQRGCPGCGLPECVLPGASELDGLREGGPSHAHLRSSWAYVSVCRSEVSTVASEIKDGVL